MSKPTTSTTRAKTPRTRRGDRRGAPNSCARRLSPRLQMLSQSVDAADQLLAEGGHRKAARLYEATLAAALLAEHPLRPTYLAALDLATDFSRDASGRIVGLSSDGQKTKSGRTIGVQFSRFLIARMKWHLALHRPVLCKPQTTRLFHMKWKAIGALVRDALIHAIRSQKVTNAESEAMPGKEGVS